MDILCRPHTNSVYKWIYQYILARLPIPKKVSKRAITVTEAIEGGMLPPSGSEDATLFTAAVRACPRYKVNYAYLRKSI